MRSVIKEVNPKGIAAVVDQQFEYALKIASNGLVPIIEPEVDIHTVNKEKAEELLLAEFNKHLAKLPETTKLMFKVTIPTKESTCCSCCYIIWYLSKRSSLPTFVSKPRTYCIILTCINTRS